MSFALDPETRFVWCVIYGNMERPEAEAFDFATMKWPEPKQ